MSKYSNELKLRVVNYYLEGNGYKTTAEYFNIPSFNTVKKWVKKYEKNGLNGLIKNQKSNYSGEFKQSVIEYMHANHLSCNEASYYFNLGNTAIVTRWERIYYEKGPQGLYQIKCGRPRKVSYKQDREKNANENEDLLKEIQHLRMENEYLKKLNALVQERIKRENKKK